MTSPFDANLALGQTLRVRDLVLMGLTPNEMICIACDSSGGYGSKPNDVRAASGEEVGFAVAKVPLMEVLAAGAQPRVLIDNLCVEMHPSGLPILAGIREACRATGYDFDISGSDETNFPTAMTGVGTTVIALLRRDLNRLASSRAGDVLVAVGTPLGGSPETADYRDSDPEVAGIQTVLDLLAIDGVHELLPVGSRGIAYECGELARTSDLVLDMVPDAPVDLQRSAGASTAVVCSTTAEAAAALSRTLPHACVVGYLG